MTAVTFISGDNLSFTFGLGIGKPTITEGLGGWQAIERQKNVALTEWTGSSPIKMTLPLLMDGFTEDESVQGELNAFYQFALADDDEPPPFFVHGPVPFSGRRWVVEAVEMGESERNDAGTLTRQHIVVTLMRFIKPDTIKIKKKGGGKGKGPKVYTAKQGDTLVSIATRQCRERSSWKKIGDLNDIRDPNKKINPGRKIKLPKDCG